LAGGIASDLYATFSTPPHAATPALREIAFPKPEIKLASLGIVGSSQLVL